MEQLKVIKKDVLILNILIYLLLSFAFLYLQYAYRFHLSPFSLVYLKKSLELFWYAIIPILFSSWMIWKLHEKSVYFFNFCIFLVSFKVVEGVFIEFNKIIVLALFFYLVISYFLYQLLKEYRGLASLNSRYSSEDLFGPILKKISCVYETEMGAFSGFLTNWDDEGCFIYLSQPLTGLPKEGKIRVEFKGREFIQDGEVVAHSRDLQGLGIKFHKSIKSLNSFNWSEFTELVDELGFKPERLK
jgi:hypothetical protein